MRWRLGAGHAFRLQAEHHHDIYIADAFLKVGGNAHSHLFDPGGKKGCRADKAYLSPQRAKQVDVGACNAAIGDISADGNLQPFDMADPAPDCQRVKQCLGGVLMPPIPSVDHCGINMMAE